jgi:hypothetical protein
MSLLGTYISKNPKIGDIRYIMSDDQACDMFRRWSIVKKNYKDMGMVEKKSANNFLPRASFKRSKGSLFSGQSNDDETL